MPKPAANPLSLNGLLDALGLSGQAALGKRLGEANPVKALAAYYAVSLYDDRSDPAANLNRVIFNLELAADELNSLSEQLRLLKVDVLESGGRYQS